MMYRFPNFMQFAKPNLYAAIDSPVTHQADVTQVAIKQQGPELWKELFLSIVTEDDLRKWEAKIPKYGCPCSDFYLLYKADHPPEFPLSFRWKYDLKSAVNAKLGHPNLTYEQAFAQWHGNKTFPRPVKKSRHRKILTAIGPNRIDRQKKCVASWLDSGFTVVAMQTSAEIDSFQPLFDGLEIKWLESNDVDSFYNFKTQKIKNLVRFPGAMLVNSDCEMSGIYDLDTSDSISEFFIRWSYNEVDFLPREFEWGLDAVYLTDEAKAVIPEDFPFCIGQAMWDYALPCILQKADIPFRINHGQWLLHLDHPQNWTDEYWWKGAHWMQDRYGINPLWFREGYRKDIEPDWKYNRVTGRWEPK